jgi:hypothetical protein
MNPRPQKIAAAVLAGAQRATSAYDSGLPETSWDGPASSVSVQQGIT